MKIINLKYCFRWLCVVILGFHLPFAGAVAVPKINAAAYVVVDEQSGTVLASQDLDARIDPAALTKLMTTYLVFQALQSGKLSADKMLSLSATGWQTDGSRMFMRQGEPVKTKTIIQGMLTVSANDAAITLAEEISGNQKAFVRQMNTQAQKLGLMNTHFVNCTGLAAEGQYSSVGDLAKLAQILKREFPQYQSWFAKKSFTHNGVQQLNRNLLLFRDDQVDGLAVGYTINGGYDLAVSSKRNGRSIIAVLVGADSSEARAAEGSKLVSWALTSFDTAKLYDAGQKIADVTVYKGARNKVAIGFVHGAYVTLSTDGARHLTTELDTVQPVVAPIRKGQELGTLKLMDSKKQIVAQKSVVALEDVAEAGKFDRWFDGLVIWWKGLFA